MTNVLGALEAIALIAAGLFVGVRLGQRVYNRMTREREERDP